MYQPEQESIAPEQLASAPTDMYLSAAELQPTENLPLEFSDVWIVLVFLIKTKAAVCSCFPHVFWHIPSH